MSNLSQIKDDPLITATEASAYMRVCRATISVYVKQGKLKSLRAGKKHLFTKQDIDNFLSNKETPKEKTEA